METKSSRSKKAVATIAAAALAGLLVGCAGGGDAVAKGPAERLHAAPVQVHVNIDVHGRLHAHDAVPRQTRQRLIVIARYEVEP